MTELADRERFEEAALARDRLRSLADAIARARADAWLVGAGSLTLHDGDGRSIRLVGGALARDAQAPEPFPLPCPRERADELAVVRSWLRTNVARVVACDRPLDEPVDGGAALARVTARLRAVDRA
jgi:hypothetical protein